MENIPLFCKDIDPAAPIGPQIHQLLRNRIVLNDLSAGTAVSETAIANEYGISRQPVREAFIKLSEEGLISIRPQRRTIIRKIDLGAVMDARFVREAVEADIVKLLCQRADTALVRELRRQLEHQRQVETKIPTDFMQADEHFHKTLAEEAGSGNAWKFVEGLKSQMDRVRVLSFKQIPAQKLVEQHTMIVDAIEQGDAAMAEAAMRQHLQEILTDLPEIQSARPALFE